MAEIVLERVSKSYGSEAALHDVMWPLKIASPRPSSGRAAAASQRSCNSSTAWSGPARGTVHVFGKPIDYDRLPELRRQIGYAVQGTGLFPHLTVERNITLLARLVGWEPGRCRSRAQELMERVGLPWTFASPLPARAVRRSATARRPVPGHDAPAAAVLLDEPFGALDPSPGKKSTRSSCTCRKPSRAPWFWSPTTCTKR